jgi:DNA-binding winged helix-turn-helix (wHTH) protein/Tol biopolymer transport system component
MLTNFRVGPWLIQPSLNTIANNGTRLRLEPKVLNVLVYLAEHRGEVVSKDELIRAVWQDACVTDDTLTRAIYELRKVLQDDTKQPKFIQTIPRRGYRLIASINPQDEQTSVDPELPKHPQVKAPEESKHSGASTGMARNKARAILRIPLYMWAVLAPAFLTGAVFILWPVSLPHVVSSSPLTNDGGRKYSPVSDGSRVYFVERERAGFTIFETSIHGGTPIRMPVHLERIALLDLSPSATDLLFGGPVEKKLFSLWILPLPAGSAHRVADVLVSGASFSPDGAQILFTRGSDIYTMKPNGAEQKKILSVANSSLFSPRMSPDGKRLRFTLFDPGAGVANIWEASANGTGAHQLWKDWQPSVGKCCGTWSADGKYFYFNTYYEFVPQDIWVAPGTDSFVNRAPIALTSGPLRYSDPMPARNNETLFVNGSQLRAELIRWDGKAFVPSLSGISATDVEFSRDGEWATYVDYPNMTLWRSRVDGSDRMQLTFAPEAFLPRWSPDGSIIMFTQIRPGSCKTLTVSRDGGTPRQLAAEDSGNQIDATWAPDGGSVVFGRSHLDPDLAIYSFDLKSRRLSKITGSDGLTAPRLSPDGRYLIALTRDWTTLKLYEFVSSTWSDFVRFESGIGYANWSHDSKSVYARIRRPGGREVVRVSLEDRQLKSVLSTEDVDEPNPLWMGLANDDSILLRRDRSARDVYTLHLQTH